jgi:hypothetical protein
MLSISMSRLQLAIVRHRVGINQVFGTLTGINERTHIIAHHVAVEHLRAQYRNCLAKQ